MKFTYTELLIMLAVLVVTVCFTWAVIYHVAPQPFQSQGVIIVETDGPEMLKAKRMALGK